MSFDIKKAMEELGLPDEICSELLAELIKQTAGQLSSIEEALRAGNTESAALLAHSIKGASANLRITPISEPARALEFEAKKNSAPHILEKSYLALKNAFEDFCRDQGEVHHG